MPGSPLYAIWPSTQAENRRSDPRTSGSAAMVAAVGGEAGVWAGSGSATTAPRIASAIRADNRVSPSISEVSQSLCHSYGCLAILLMFRMHLSHDWPDSAVDVLARRRP